MVSNISRILSKIASTPEALHYLGLYTNIEPERFAVVKISGECIEDKVSLEVIAQDLVDLYGIGLRPIVTHGWGKILDTHLKKKGIESKFHSATHDRITDRGIMQEVLDVAKETGIKLVDAISEVGEGKIYVKFIDYKKKAVIAKDKGEDYGCHNGEIIGINTKPILNAIKQGFIPIVSPIGISADGNKVYNLNAATVGAGLAKTIDPIKYVMVTGNGGVLDDKGKIISEIVLRRDYHRLMNWLIFGGMAKNVDEAKHSLEQRLNGDNRSVQIVGADNFIKELFSRKGAGTYIRNGYIVNPLLLEDVNKNIIKFMIEKEFNEKLRDNYFEEKKIIYMEKNRKGFGIVIPGPAETCPYLDVIVVGSIFVRNGLGSDIMRAILDSQNSPSPKLSWRSRADREANEWYFDISTGHQQFRGVDGRLYNGFWIGLSPDEAAKAIQYMQQKPSNFK